MGSIPAFFQPQHLTLTVIPDDSKGLVFVCVWLIETRH
jgi:hypothetical protein